ncbi:T9SS type A sorting domain-containing protein [Hymenobacter sp. B81]|uniref:T9SS type A sorting domain-containing protein n=1 Tax=Hymenobacter sp. B81 TaxID=3344878 RepID=UPI0037DDE2BC
MPFSLPFSTRPGLRAGGWLLTLGLLGSSYARAQAPANDLCVNAIAVACGQSLTGSNVNATAAGDPDFNCGFNSVGGPGVLYAFTGTNEVATVSLCGPGTNFDTKLHVFSGSCGTFTCVGSNDDACGLASEVSFYGTVGTTYYILVSGYNGATGDFDLNVSCAPPADRVITSGEDLSGVYRNVTIASGGEAELRGPLLVTGTLTVQNGGALNTNFDVVTGNAFVLQAGGQLSIGSEEGIAASGATGAVQTSTRSFSDDASYRYRINVPVFSSNFTALAGSGLPPRVRELAVLMLIDGPAFSPRLQLSNNLSVARKLSLLGSLDPNGRTVTLLSDATAGTALVENVYSPAFSVLGPVTVQRAIDPALNAGAGYRHFSSPVQGSTVSDLTTAGFSPVVNPAYNASATPNLVTPYPTVFGYDEGRLATSPAAGLSAFDKGWVSPAAPSSPLEIGRGYTVNIPASSKVDFVGLLTEGDVPLTLSRGAQAEGGWNLIGNPYPAPLDWSLVNVPAGLDNALYAFQSNSRYGGSYRAYVNGIGNPVVALGQGFFVRVSQPNSVVNLMLTDEARVTEFSAQPTLRRRAETRPLVQLTLTRAGSALADEAHVYFEAGATAGVDATHDARKIQHNSGGMPSIWSAAAGTELAINGLPELGRSAVVPLGVALPQAGTYTLAAAQLLNLSPATVYLHDALTGQLVDLRQQASYSFTVTGAAVDRSRFSLRFEPLRPTATQAVLSAASVQVFPNPARQSFTLQLPAVPGVQQVQAVLLNALGQVVRRQTAPLPAAGARVACDVQGLPAGVYVLRLQAGAEELTRRVVVE